MLLGNPLLDPQTGLGNFFGMLQAATNAAFGTKGTIITLDLTELIKSEADDRKTVDSYIRALAGLLRAEIARNDYRRMAAFRIGDGEFVVVLPEKTQAEAENLATEISVLFREKAFWHGVPDAGIRTSTVTYGEYGKNGVPFPPSSKPLIWPWPTAGMLISPCISRSGRRNSSTTWWRGFMKPWTCWMRLLPLPCTMRSPVYPITGRRGYS